MKNILLITGVIVTLLVGGVWWSSSLQKGDPDIVSRSGLHWHPQLTVYVKGEKQEIPANLGIGPQYANYPGYEASMGMMGMHTHDAEGIIHFEFPGLVRKGDLTLSQFFKIWGKDIESFGSSVTMTVNGKDNTELQNYFMQDKDIIELRYE